MKQKQKQKILLVDDEPEFVEMTRMRLEANDYEVVTASNGRECLRVAEEEKPELILLDVMMPEMDGFSALGKLRRLPETRTTPIVMLTAKRDTRSIFKSKDLWATDYLMKPCDPDELLETVRRYARRV
ncbi:MAG: response regulator [Kiritimatiellia bacterium]|nr:response regulator [Kiritimatiellia bacterium]